MIRRLAIVLVLWWKRWSPTQQWTVTLTPDEPESYRPRILYLVGESRPWAAVFLCPCGCEQLIWLNLLSGHQPQWSIKVDRRSVPTVTPSVNRQVGCRSHFLLRAGRVIWCGSRVHLTKRRQL